MPTPDLDERFRRWLKLIAEMHDGANFTANQTIAWAALRKPLSECRVALVSTAGVHLKSQPAHDLLNPHGDASFREIPGDTQMIDMAVDHVHYDTTDANIDPNCVFPLDRLRELVDMGMIGSLVLMHYGFMGFIPDGRLLRDTTAPIVAERLLAQGTDVVVLTPGWPMCHQSVGLLQGAIEQRGIPTISVTVRPEITAHANVSRACYVRFPTGNPIGEPHKPEQQRMILTAVLEQLVEIKEPGTIVELPFCWRRM